MTQEICTVLQNKTVQILQARLKLVNRCTYKQEHSHKTVYARSFSHGNIKIKFPTHTHTTLIYNDCLTIFNVELNGEYIGQSGAK